MTLSKTLSTLSLAGALFGGTIALTPSDVEAHQECTWDKKKEDFICKEIPGAKVTPKPKPKPKPPHIVNKPKPKPKPPMRPCRPKDGCRG